MNKIEFLSKMLAESLHAIAFSSMVSSGNEGNVIFKGNGRNLFRNFASEEAVGVDVDGVVDVGLCTATAPCDAF
ncbi:hypothetical protein [uncultured Gammaproteobacteria bacterium]|nr:hypothetical protein [uncultured Gammaproteobacteria bacterium]